MGSAVFDYILNIVHCPTKQHTENKIMLEFSIDKIIAYMRNLTNTTPAIFLLVDLQNQRLSVINNSSIARSYLVSTSKFGIGNKENSLMTPRGLHRIKEKYGHNAPIGRVFRDRIDTKEDWPIGMPGDNLILTRILRLEGLEPGINKGQGIDTFDRYIYIHGTNNESAIGTHASHGCVCMKNTDIVELFDMVSEGTLVFID